MIWVVLAAIVILVVAYLGSLYIQGEIRQMVRALRWVVGGLLLAGGAFSGLRGQLFLASLLGAGGVGVLVRGRLGPIDFGSGLSSPNNASTVTSHYLSMRLDHETGSVSGRVQAGHFSGRDLGDLSAEECWAFYIEIEDDADSLALYESWLDANRSGWREYFASEFGMRADDEEPAGNHKGNTAAVNGMDEAYEILGLAPGASADAIRSAHRKLMKKVHPDAGGSAFLAAKINLAKDLLLSAAQSKR